MADDDITDDDPKGSDYEVVPEDIEDLNLEEEIDLEGDLGEAEAEDEDEDVEAPAPHRRKEGEEEDDDDEELDPEDVEADLDTILKDRIAANDDENEEDEDEAVASAAPKTGREGVVARQEDEMNCPNCFLLVHESVVQINGECPHCGEPISL